MRNIEQFRALLVAKGARVTRDDGRLIFINAEASPNLFDYWNDNFYLGVSDEMVELSEEYGWYFEWEDAGTLVAVPY